MDTNAPPQARMFAVIDGTKKTLRHEKSMFDSYWNLTWQPTLEGSQASFDAVVTAHRIGEAPITASALFVASALQAVTHNVTMGVLNNPALIGNSNIQQLMGAIVACRNDETIPKLVQDTPPYDSVINQDGSVTLSEYVDE